MNPAHAHIILTHFPIAGIFFGLLILFISWRGQRGEWAAFGLSLLVVAALFTIPLYLTGESAEEVVEHIAGVSESLIEKHEGSAEVSLILIEILGGLSLVALFLQCKRQTISLVLIRNLLFFGLIVFAQLGWTANLGGEIRHSEIRSDAIVPSRIDAKSHDDDDD